ncbi:MAG TPA: hypothetical protein VK988_15530 [Acidimicrobiales bacterium]|nr:hypothetical protein [Acidimicrobiales bacterium]
MADERGDDRGEGDRAHGDMREPHEHAWAAGAPGASGPGEAGYEGEAMVGDEGGAAGPESFEDPFGRPDSGGPPPTQ